MFFSRRPHNSRKSSRRQQRRRNRLTDSLAAAEKLEERKLLTATNWIDGNDGLFSAPTSWDGGVPRAGDTAVFDVGNGNYTVLFGFGSGNQASERLVVGDDDVRFLMLGTTYELADQSTEAVIVGDTAGRLPIFSDNGSLSIQSGTLEATGVTIGRSAFQRLREINRATGTVNVGLGGVLNTETIIVGRGGQGTLNVEGGNVRTAFGSIGFQSTARGQVNVTGVEDIAGQIKTSRWIDETLIQVGSLGSGTLVVGEHGIVGSRTVTIGQGTGSSGTAVVGGENATLYGSLMFVGGRANSAGGRGHLEIKDGGGVSAGDRLRVWDDGTVHLNGGTLSAGRISFPAGATADTFRWDSGRLVLRDEVVVVDAGLDHPFFAESLDLSTDMHLDARAGLVIGQDGVAALSARDGATVRGEALTLGSNADSEGILNIDGVGSMFTPYDRSRAYVGFGGIGAINVTAGGVMDMTYAGVGVDLSLGVQESARGDIVVRDASSSFTAGLLGIGLNGDGSLRFSDGAFGRLRGMTVAVQTSSDGLVSVTGPGTQLDAGSVQLYRGNGRAEVLDGGRIDSLYLTIGTEAQAEGTVVVDGENSTWVAAGDVAVGAGGVGLLQILDGGYFSMAPATAATIGVEETASGSAVQVDGADSTWRSSNPLTVGYGGVGSLEITDGGYVRNRHAVIAEQPGSDGSRVSVVGQNSKWEPVRLTVGDNAAGSLHVADGGLVMAADSQAAANATGQAAITVDGPGARLLFETSDGSTNLSLGTAGQATLDVLRGGVTTAAEMRIGDGAGSTAHARVSGFGSSISVDRMFLAYDAGATGVLTVADRAAVNVAETLEVREGGSLYLHDAAISADAVLVAGGMLSGEGTINAPVTSRSVVSPGIEAGRLTITGDFNNRGEVLIELGGRLADEFDQLDVDGAAFLDGTLRISLINGFRPEAGDSFAVMTFDVHVEEFAAYEGLDLGAGLTLEPVYTESGLDLVVRQVSVTAAPALVMEGDTGRSQALFRVELSEPAAERVIISYATSDGTAVAGEDYEAVSGSIEFAPGETTADIVVPILGDTTAEGTEEFILTLSGTGGAVLPESQVVGTIVEQQKVTAGQAEARAEFGGAVDVDGTVAVVAAPLEDGAGVDQGAVYVFELADGHWINTARLSAPDASDRDRFGYSLAVSGDTIAVGVRSDDDRGLNSGSVHMFDRNTGGRNNWGLTTKVHDPSGRARDQFGHAVDLAGGTMVVGARLDDGRGTNSGSAFVFERSRNAGSWVLQRQLKSDVAASGDQFGYSVAVAGDVVVVGARKDDAAAVDSGSAWVFERNVGGPDNWGQRQMLEGPDGKRNDWFGYSVAVSDETIVVGQPIRNNIQRAGRAYVYDWNAFEDKWVLTNELAPSGPANADQFGISVALDGDRTLVGARLDDTRANNGGAAYVFDRISTLQWNERTSVFARDLAPGDQLGTAVAMSGETGLIGYPLDDDSGPKSGGALFTDFDELSGNIAAAFNIARSELDAVFSRRDDDSSLFDA